MRGTELTKKQKTWWKNQVNIIRGNIKGKVPFDVQDCYEMYLEYLAMKKLVATKYIKEEGEKR